MANNVNIHDISCVSVVTNVQQAFDSGQQIPVAVDPVALLMVRYGNVNKAWAIGHPHPESDY